MRNLILILSALVKNKYRFAADAKRSKKVGFGVMIAAAYVLITSYAILMTVVVGGIMNKLGYAVEFYVALLLIGAMFVLVFGIIHLISTLFLAKDITFYSAMPVKPVTVFSAKLLFVYLSEAVIAVAVMLPALITYGIVIHAGYGFYLVTLATVLVMPALPLALAAIIGVPVMFLAGKLKHRDIVPLIFYCVLFIGFFAAYYYAVFKMSTDDFTDDGIAAFGKGLQSFTYAVYPYLALARAAIGLDNFGIGAGASIAANIAIFFGISAALIGILVGLGRLMYGKSTTAANQTDNSRSKNGEFKSTGTLRALVKREYGLAFHTTSTAFQCFSVMLLVIMVSVIMSLMMRSTFGNVSEGAIDDKLSVLLVLGTMCMMLPSVSNAAATSFSREGSGLAVLKTLPIDVGTIIKVKAIAWCALGMPCALISAVIANSFNFDVLTFVLSVPAFVGLSAAFTVFGMMWDLRSPKLRWSDPKEAVKQNANVTFGQLACILSGIVFIIAATVFIALGVPYRVASSVFVSIMYVYLAIFVIIDIIIVKKAEYYYNRIEL